MLKHPLITLVLAAILILAACGAEPQITPTPSESPPAVLSLTPSPSLTPTQTPPTEPAILISEVMTGVDGNNNFEFIELYNTGPVLPIDLKGWSLWYKLSNNDKEILVYHWNEHTLVPPQGHYLLVREGQDVGAVPDSVFEISMIPQRGGLQLRGRDNTVADSLTWGDGPVEFAELGAAPAMKNGLAIERMPGGNKGNWIDTDINSADFAFSSPGPQNVGSPVTPEQGDGLTLSVEAPTSVAPGDQFAYNITVTNETANTINDVTVQFPISLALKVVQAPDDIEILEKARFWGLEQIGETNHIVLWNVGSLDSGDSDTARITVSAPWTYTTVMAANYTVQVEGWHAPVMGSPVRTSVEGGRIPIGVLKNLVGEDVVIEGTATMYTGGYYAGSGNVKFYLEDETGGVQIWVPNGEGEVVVSIGDRVRAAGKLEIYRGALELVVNDLAEVETYPGGGDDSSWSPTAASIVEAAVDATLAGKLIQIEGRVTRNEEFTYSYEIDLLDESGHSVTLYVDKLTEINIEGIERDQFYRASGILEILDTRQLLYPRVQADLERVYPPVLALEMVAPNTVAPGDNLEITLTATNYTPDLLTDVTITATLPQHGGFQFVAAHDGAEIDLSNIIWTIPDLDGNGTRVSVNYEIRVTAEDGYLTFDAYMAAANEWRDPVSGIPYLIFIGDSVPIWAIQGLGDRSPYTFGEVKTAGIVTGIFPELGGFWIQEDVTDKNPLTSAGLFVNTGELDIPIAAGNYVQVSGTVREVYQQTQVQISRQEDIIVLREGGPLPASMILDPPPDVAGSNAYFESLEGMLVQIGEPAVAVGPTSQYGEYVLVLSGRGIDRLWQGDDTHNGLAIMVDDGSSTVHEDSSTLPYVVNKGDQVVDLIGPLAYTFGRYKIEPIVQPQVTGNEIHLPAFATDHDEQFSIMTWNVENLFDVLDPHPSGETKPSIRAYKVSIAKVANTILAAGAPTIVGLQEVENIDVLGDIAEHEVLKDFDYQPFLIEGSDSRLIDNGYLVRGDTARVVDVQQQVAPEGLTSRPPLQIEVEIESDGSPVRLFVLNNHFTTMSGGEGSTEPRRNAQAAWNVTILDNILGEDPDAYVAVIGDLNSFYESLPIDTLRDGGLIHVFEIDPQGGWYSYVYQGFSQTLDHILVTSHLYDLLQRVDILHVNADYAPVAAEDESPLGKSDHDPVIATFSVVE